MAKRRRLDAPTPEDLTISREGAAASSRPPLGPSAPPIARIAAETAGFAASEVIEARRVAAAHEGDATRWREAARDGRVASAVPLGDIAADFLDRDRLALDEEAMAELRRSIRTHGLRMPVEVLRLEAESGPPRYGLISGWRRVQAMRSLWAETGDPRFSTVAALVRQPATAADAYVAMVEENEVRADLSHFERGRVAVLAAGQGVFRTVDEAVEALFASGSKAKRSKIRSFALIFEQLGDLLAFGPMLSERQGLRLAAAVRDGAGDACRRALGAAGAGSAEAEWAALEPALASVEGAREGARPRGGRPRSPRPRAEASDRRNLGRDVVMDSERRPDELTLRFHGAGLDDGLAEEIVAVILEKFAALG